MTKQGRSYEDPPRLPEGELLDPRLLLESSEAVELELGPGTGTFLLERLESDSTVRIFGLEIRRKWATLVDERIRARGHAARARVFAEDARVALPRLASGSLSRIYVHFPDPWWKKKHQKRVLLQRPLCDQAARLLRAGGELFVQTDVPERADEYERLLLAHEAFSPLEASPRTGDPEFGARSSRERRALADGLPIVRLRFRRLAG